MTNLAANLDASAPGKLVDIGSATLRIRVAVAIKGAFKAIFLVPNH